MNLKALSRNYDLLAGRERMVLILAAESRNDDLERERLVTAAPIRRWHFSDYLMPMLGLNVLGLIYLTEQLDALANYWHANWRLADPDDAGAEDWHVLANVSAYFFACNAEAWRRFCDEMKVNPEQVTEGNYRGWLLQHCEERMPENAPSADELAALLRAYGQAEPALITAESLLESWRSLFNQMPGHDIGKEGAKA